MFPIKNICYSLDPIINSESTIPDVLSNSSNLTRHPKWILLVKKRCKKSGFVGLKLVVGSCEQDIAITQN